MSKEEISKTVSTVLALLAVSILLVPLAYCHEIAGEAKLAGNYSDRSIDIDGDGLYDVLIVEAEVEVLTSGEYSLMGFLYTLHDEEVVWSIDHGMFDPGRHSMLLEFDGGTIEKSGKDGPYILKKVVLSSGSSPSGQKICDYATTAYRTSHYESSEFTYPSPSVKTISGTGRGEILVTFTVESTTPVHSGRYSYDIVGISIPPIASPMTVKGSKTGYAFDLPGVFMPNKPNNFTVTAEGARNLNIGLKKPQGERIRTWVTTLVEATEDGVAKAETDLISPGSYHVKIFGDAAEGATQVNLTMTMEKKLIIDGRFSLGINTTGFPSGNYSVDARAVNGTFTLDEFKIGGLSMED